MAPVQVPSLPWGIANPSTHLASRAKAAELALSKGFPEASFVEINVVWGDQDMNGHVNNCVFFKWLEAGRISYINELLRIFMPPTSSTKQSISLILGALSNTYIRPVFSKDTVLVAHKLKAVAERKFILESFIYSYAQNTQVAKGEASMHMFDYTNQKGVAIPEPFKKALEKMIEAEPQAKL